MMGPGPNYEARHTVSVGLEALAGQILSFHVIRELHTPIN